MTTDNQKGTDKRTAFLHFASQWRQADRHSGTGTPMRRSVSAQDLGGMSPRQWVRGKKEAAARNKKPTT